jgi:hypothetical protein
MLERGVRRYYLQRWPSSRAMKRIRARIKALTGKGRAPVDIRDLIVAIKPIRDPPVTARLAAGDHGNWYANSTQAMLTDGVHRTATHSVYTRDRRRDQGSREQDQSNDDGGQEVSWPEPRVPRPTRDRRGFPALADGDACDRVERLRHKCAADGVGGRGQAATQRHRHPIGSVDENLSANRSDAVAGELR